MNDAINHSPDLGPIRQGKSLMEPSKPEAPYGLLLVVGASDRTPDPFDGNRFVHVECLSFPPRFHVFYQPPLLESSTG
jgi:hypothetical protein